MNKNNSVNTYTKYLWMILLIAVLVLFKASTDIDPVAQDSPSYMEFGNLRPPFYPLMVHIFGEHIIAVQDILWLLTGFLVLRFGVVPLVFYCFTIGLLFLSQKILTETVFVFLITLAAVTKKDTSFLLLCLTLLIKPVMILFVPIAYYFHRPRIWVSLVAMGLILTSTLYAFEVGSYLNGHYELSYFKNLAVNCVGKTVGIESLFFQRLTQLQTLCYVLLAVMAAFFYRQKIIYALPLYLVLASGFAPNQGDRLVIIIAPICLMLLGDMDLSPDPYYDELEKQYPGDSCGNLRRKTNE